jgi:sulfur relay (sulfurtransferase) DsrF/TusC family protein
MIFGRQASRVLVYESPVDMRKSFDGLQAVAMRKASSDSPRMFLLRLFLWHLRK